MRTIHVDEIISTVQSLCQEANFVLPQDVRDSLILGQHEESSLLGVEILGDLIKNADLAASKKVPMCQDTGMAVFFVAIGQALTIEGGLLTDAINEGVRRGYKEGYLRKSVVKDPLRRVNTQDNTPAIIHYDLVAGDKLTIQFAAKGFGSENMSRSVMLKPSDGIEGVKAFVIETVSLAGPNPCPPIVVGVGIGGTLDKAAQIAKFALLRKTGQAHPDPYYADLEKVCLEEINALGIGPQGLGGNTTALAVHIETFPTHLAGLPLVVNINCHASRHLTAIL